RPGAREGVRQAGYDEGSGCWKAHRAEQGDAFRPIATRGVNQDGFDVAGPRLGVEVEREKFRDENDEDHGRIAEPEPEDRQRDPRDARNWIEGSDDRIDEFTNRTDAATAEAQRRR